jgi:hypothetical protein
MWGPRNAYEETKKRQKNPSGYLAAVRRGKRALGVYVEPSLPRRCMRSQAALTTIQALLERLCREYGHADGKSPNLPRR